MKKVRKGGGWPAIWYTLSKAREVGGFGRLWKALRSKNACKTCALGMGGQRGGMVNEAGQFPEVCKKSMQAMAADMQPGITAEFWKRYGVNELRAMSPRQLEACGRLVEPVVSEPGSKHYTPIGWDDALERVAKSACCISRRRNLLVLQRPQQQRSRLSASGVSPGSTGRTT